MRLSMGETGGSLRPRRWAHRLGGQGLGGAICLALLPTLAGCLNPELINSVTGNLFPTAPGDEPFLGVRVINDTSGTLTLPVQYEDGFGTHTYLISLLPPDGRDTGILLHWPVRRVALGSLDDPFAPLIAAEFGPLGDVIVPFGHAALESGVDFGRGDTLVFHIVEDARSAAFITVSLGRIDAAVQPQNAARGDPYAAVRLLLENSGF